MNYETITIGVDGLDTVLNGGCLEGRMYLVSGDPGTGKTMLGSHFLEAGLEQGETVLYIHGEETREELRESTAAIGIDIDDAKFLDLGPDTEYFIEDQTYSLVDPSAVDQTKYTEAIFEAIREIDPDRIVLDPITQLRYVQSNEGQFRRQILSFFRFLKDRDITILATMTPTPDHKFTQEIRSLSDGVIEMSRTRDGRRLEVGKHRTAGQIDGEHGMNIRDTGIEVFPALIPEGHDQVIGDVKYSSGIEGLDQLLGGGIEQNTVTFLSGPTGIGKTTLGAQFLTVAGERGLNAELYLFEESVSAFTRRCEAIGLPVTTLRDRGVLSLTPIEPLAFSPEEFASVLRDDIDENDLDVIMIDGLDGYTKAIQGDVETLVRKFHSLTRHLTNDDITVLVTDEISKLTGISSATSSNLSYIADNVIFLSYVEMDSSLRSIIGVLKKRTGPFEHTIREFQLTADGIRIGEPLSGVSGLVQGVTRVKGESPRKP